LKIAIAASEMVPFVKVGGLGDVVGALPRELARLGHEVKVFLPKPPGMTAERFPNLTITSFGATAIPLFGGTAPAVIERGRIAGEDNLEIILIRNDRFFDRVNPYVDPATGLDWPDNDRRYTFFAKAIIQGMIALDWTPDAIHLNDYQTGLVPILLREGYRYHQGLARAGIIYAIHNMGYQGIYPVDVLQEIDFDLPTRFFFPTGPLEYYGKVNFMKAAIVFSDLISTVSERYAEEIQSGEEFGFGLEGVLKDRTADVIGILNGIDTDIWDPARDPLIPHHYSAGDMGPKRENKVRLLESMELPVEPGTPVIGMITRLVEQKGIDLVVEAAERLVAMKMKLVILGSGPPRWERPIRELAASNPKLVAVSLTFNDPLAHLIEAGSDMFLMPSRYEPCGLNQMYSLRYGTIPIVRATGGLADTVRDYDPATGRGNGFVFEEYTADAMVDAITRAIAAYQKKSSWKKLMSEVMRADFSWARAAQKYVHAYERAAARRK
jgi:starch synthase